MTVTLLHDVHRPKGRGAWLRKQILRSYARLVEWTTLLPGRALNLNALTPFLFVGGGIARADYPRLKALGITAVIDLRSERKDDEAALNALGVELLHLPAKDRFAPSLVQLKQGVDWAQKRIEQGGTVYVHCQHGVGRAPLMALCILVARGQTAPAAYAELRARRWQATLNDRQLAALQAFSEAQRGLLQTTETTERCA